jgi:hypothetical protein
MCDVVVGGDMEYSEKEILICEFFLACVELISLMIVPEHAKRASIEQIMVHPWLVEGYDHPVMFTLVCPFSPMTNYYITCYPSSFHPCFYILSLSQWRVMTYYSYLLSSLSLTQISEYQPHN